MIYVFTVQVTNNTYVCSDHFTSSDYISRATFCKRRDLKPDAVPSVFNWSKQKAVRKPPTSRHEPSYKAEASQSVAMVSPVTENTQGSVFLFPSDHDYDCKPTSVVDQLKAAQEQLAVRDSSMEQLRGQLFGLQRFSNDKKLIKFYTGFVSYELLINFYHSIAQHALSARTWAQVQRGGESDTSSNGLNSLLPIDQMFMFLHKLRLGSLDQELADKFNVSQTTVSRNTKTWCNLLYVILGSQPLWPSRRLVRKFMPASFRKLYPDTRVIIDCTELYIQSPASMVLNSRVVLKLQIKNYIEMFGWSNASRSC
jgi:hypothetical protein